MFKSIKTAGQLYAEKRSAEIMTRLDAIDIESSRPMRAVMSGNGSEFDIEKIGALEAEAKALRQELSQL